MSNASSEFPEPTASLEPLRSEDPASDSEPSGPEFGLVDVIEAFTAMRHEWRGQTRESRELAAAIQDATERIVQLQEGLVAAQTADSQPAENATVYRLVEAITEIDLHLTRAVDATARYEQSRTDPVTVQLRDSVNRRYHKLSFPARWVCRRFFESILATIDKAVADQQARHDPTIEGLKLVVSRVRRLMHDQEIQRVETVGRRFDAEEMNAIEAVSSETEPSGHVIDQLSPAYMWRGRLVRYAEVRIAR